DKEIRAKLIERYDRGRLSLKREMAFFFAQEGERWSSAQQYASENYQALKQGLSTSYGCIDTFVKAEVADIYAFVRLASLAHNVEAYGEAPDVREVRDMRSILIDARTQLKETGSDTTGLCFNKERGDLWYRRLSDHIKLADAMLR